MPPRALRRTAGEAVKIELRSKEVATLMEGLEVRRAMFERHGLLWGEREFVDRASLPSLVQDLLSSPDGDLAAVFDELDADTVIALGRRVDLSQLDALIATWLGSQDVANEGFWQRLLTQHAWVFSQLVGSPVVVLNERAYVGGKGIDNDNLSIDDQAKILDYKLMIYHCEGTEDEKLRWFEIINIAGETLKPQELRNAIYTGPWLTDAKRYFSRENQAAHLLARDYVAIADVDRQALLEKAITWVSGKGDDKIKAYMNEHRLDPNATALWTYFKNVVDWAKLTFPKVRNPLKPVRWNELYEQFKDATLDSAALEIEVKQLMQDAEVEKKSGIYEYVLTRDERVLGLRAFDNNQKREAYERQDGVCPQCGDHYEFEEMDGDHILPWARGGKTTAENCQMLCVRDNRSRRR